MTGRHGGNQGGRPTKYSQEVAEAILRGIASGRSSAEVCAELGLNPQTAALWRGKYPEFRTAYVEAFAARCYGFAEEAIQILDDCPEDAEMPRVQRERHRADLRKFFATRLVPMLQDVPMVAAGATVNVYLPAKGSIESGMRVIEGDSTRLLEDGTDEAETD